MKQFVQINHSEQLLPGSYTQGNVWKIGSIVTHFIVLRS